MFEVREYKRVERDWVLNWAQSYETEKQAQDVWKAVAWKHVDDATVWHVMKEARNG